MLNLNDIKPEVDRIASRLGALERELPTYGISRDSGYPHVEVNSLGYHYVAMERGQETFRRTTQSLDELLYWVFEGITFSRAGIFEVQHRNQKEDCRRLMFKHQVELMSSLSRSWGERLEKEQQEILRVNPFNDRRKS